VAPRTMRCALFASFSCATARASSYVAPPTTKIMMACRPRQAMDAATGRIPTHLRTLLRRECRACVRVLRIRDFPARGTRQAQCGVCSSEALGARPLLMLSTVLNSSGWCCV
jgi:hypothetical protein